LSNIDTCDSCGKRRELWHNESTGLSFCEPCDMQAWENYAEDKGLVEAPAEDVQLLERDTAGLRVTLTYRPSRNDCLLACATSVAQTDRVVSLESAMDAFHHPMLYLSEACVAELGVA